MSTQKNEPMKKTEMKEIAQHNHVVGAKQIRKAFARGTVKSVFLAKNADPSITEPLALLCRDNAIECIWVKSMADLGAACGIEVRAAAAAIVA